VSLLIPKFHPITWAVLAAAYLLCLFQGGEPNPEVVRADPTLLLLGGVLAAGAVKEAFAARRAKKDAEALAAAGAARLKGFETAMAPVVDPAKERIADPTQYKESDAIKREKLEDTQKALEAQTRGEEAEIKRGAGAAPYWSGRQLQMMDDLRKRRADAVSGTRLGIERQADVMAAQKEAADKALLQGYAAQQAGLRPMPGASAPGLGERLLGVGLSGATTAAQMGMFGEGGALAGGGAGAAPAAPGAGSSALSSSLADPSNPAGDRYGLAQPTTFSYGG
jgi:hypothetical protein